MLYLHGGAYLIGSPATHRAITTHLARRCAAEVCAVDYRRAPEHPFPAARDDALAVYLALLEAGHSPRRLLLAGDSAGGHLALSVAARLPDGREALARLLEALPTPAAGERLRVAVLDTRAGLWLDQGMASLLRPGLELTLFERSRVLLDAAATRLPERIVVQALDDGLLPAASRRARRWPTAR